MSEVVPDSYYLSSCRKCNDGPQSIRPSMNTAKLQSIRLSTGESDHTLFILLRPVTPPAPRPAAPSS